MINVSSRPQLRQKVHSLSRMGQCTGQRRGGGLIQIGASSKLAFVHGQWPIGWSKLQKGELPLLFRQKVLMHLKVGREREKCMHLELT